MGRHVSISDARAMLPALVAEAAAGEDITITRHGQPIAVLVRPQRLRRPEVQKYFDAADHLGEQLEAARHLPLVTVDRPPGWAEDWVAEIYADRARDD
jgi:prevent-host-death family protein